MSDEDDDEEDDIIAMVPISESSKLVSLEKMVWLLAVLVEHSRGDDNRVRLTELINDRNTRLPKIRKHNMVRFCGPCRQKSIIQ